MSTPPRSDRNVGFNLESRSKVSLSHNSVIAHPDFAAPTTNGRFSLCGAANNFGVRIAALASVCAEALPVTCWVKQPVHPITVNLIFLLRALADEKSGICIELLSALRLSKRRFTQNAAITDHRPLNRLKTFVVTHQRRPGWNLHHLFSGLTLNFRDSMPNPSG